MKNKVIKKKKDKLASVDTLNIKQEEKDPNHIFCAKSDFLFKSVVASKKGERILKAVIEEAIGIKVEKLEYLNTEIEKIHTSEQIKRVDCLVKTGGLLINIEVNPEASIARIQRNFRYLASKHNLRFKEEGGKYQYLKSVQINLDWNAKYRQTMKRYIVAYDKNSYDRLPIEFETYFFNMDKINKICYSKDGKRKYKYLKMLTIEDKEELREYCRGDEIMEEYMVETFDLNEKKLYRDVLTKEEDEALIREADLFYAERDRSIAIAKNMLKMNLNIKIISKATGLSIKEIEKLMG